MTIAFFVRSVSRLSASASTSPASAYIRQRMLRVYTSAYVCQPLVCIRVHFPCVGIHTSAYVACVYVSIRLSAACLHPRPLPLRRHTYVSVCCVCIRQHTRVLRPLCQPLVCIRVHFPCVGIRRHTSAYVSVCCVCIRQHTSVRRCVHCWRQ
jgi:hypothetical protein